ncbi:glycosyltransferase family 2 protein [Buttiauxella noackiae]|uniref:glycosyltransferase family 2 protein n=1 Tax=Buttiauxella noackiae TaxID=82992 RepID=UPI0028D7FFCF|nr:glycosyltransferase family 2 protein [Buttiauxella noackiae]
MIKFTVITSTYNCAENLKLTADSIRAQVYPHIQWIIADGASSDRTLQIITENIDIVTNWFSEPDSGIYDAWNKACQYISGDWIIFMGAGDVFCDTNTLLSVAEKLGDNNSVSTVYGDVYLVNGPIVVGKYGKVINQWECGRPALPPHQGTFQRSNLFLKESELFDKTLKIAADSDFLLRTIYKQNLLYLNIPIANMDASGVSSSNQNRSLVRKEIKYVLKKNKINVPLSVTIRTETSYWITSFAKKLLPRKLLAKMINTKRKIFGLR